MDRFLVTEKFPCEPTALKLPGDVHVVLVERIHKVPMLQAAVRVLLVVQQKGCWAGVTWEEIIARMLAEKEDQARLASVKRENEEAKRCFENSRRRYYFLCTVTLGIFALFVARPKEPKYKSALEIFPFGFCIFGIPDFMYGIDNLLKGLQQLVDVGMLRVEPIRVNDRKSAIFYPTSRLAEVATTGWRF